MNHRQWTEAGVFYASIAGFQAWSKKGAAEALRTLCSVLKAHGRGDLAITIVEA